MKKLIAIAALGAILLAAGPAVFAGEQEGPVFEPRPIPPYSTYSAESAQATQILSPGDQVREPLNPDVRG
ncbi:MAG: hypothetical protein ACT4PY_02245 [Armatimonadota bacterium]